MNKVLISSIVLIIASCSLAKFDKYPGEKQQAFPENMRGTYYFVMPASWKTGGTKTIKAGDTLYYKIDEHAVTIMDSAYSERKTLGKDQVLSLVGEKYYVLSTRDEDHENYWNCFIYRPEKKRLLIYPVIDEIREGKLKYYFNRKFIGMNESTDSLFVYSMNDSLFTRYFEKELKEDKTLKMRKINP